MRDGDIVETGDVDTIFDNAAAPLYQGPAGRDAADRRSEPCRASRRQPVRPSSPRRCSTVDDLKVYFPIRTGGIFVPETKPLRAVDGVSFTLRQGETLGIVGESGCGKSTLARAVLKLVPKTDGAVVWMGRDMGTLADPRTAQAAQGIPDRLPGPAGEPGPAHDDRRIHRRAAQGAAARTDPRRRSRSGCAT